MTTTHVIPVELNGAPPRFGRQADPSAVTFGSTAVPAGNDQVRWTISNPTAFGGTTTIAAIVLANPTRLGAGLNADSFLGAAGRTFVWKEAGWSPPSGSLAETSWVAIPAPTAAVLAVEATEVPPPSEGPTSSVRFHCGLYCYTTTIGLWYAESSLTIQGPATGGYAIVPPCGDTSGQQNDFFDDWTGAPASDRGQGTRDQANPRISSVTFYGDAFIEGVQTVFDDGPSRGHGSTNHPTTMTIADGDYLVYAGIDVGPVSGQPASATFVTGVTLLTKKGHGQHFGSTSGGTGFAQIGEPGGDRPIVSFLGFLGPDTLDVEGAVIALGGVLGPAPS